MVVWNSYYTYTYEYEVKSCVCVSWEFLVAWSYNDVCDTIREEVRETKKGKGRGERIHSYMYDFVGAFAAGVYSGVGLVIELCWSQIYEFQALKQYCVCHCTRQGGKKKKKETFKYEKENIHI